MNPRTPSDSHDFTHVDKEQLYALGRRQDLMCQFLFGTTINGEGVVRIDPTTDSWCGRISSNQQTVLKRLDEMNRKFDGLEKRFLLGTGWVIGAGVMINVVTVIWNHYAR